MCLGQKRQSDRCRAGGWARAPHLNVTERQVCYVRNRLILAGVVAWVKLKQVEGVVVVELGAVIRHHQLETRGQRGGFNGNSKVLMPGNVVRGGRLGIA